MRETKKKKIGDREYTYHVTQFGAREGGRVLVRLLKMVGGAVGEAVKGEAEHFDMTTVGKMIGNLADTVSEEDFDYLCDTFAKASEVSGGEYREPVLLTTDGVFDLHFAGAYVELGQWLLFAVEVNFGSFLGEGFVEKLKAAASVRQVSPVVTGGEVSPSKSPNT